MWKKWEFGNMYARNEEMVVSGNGEMEDYSLGYKPPWNKQSIKTIIIGNSVTSIGNYSFYQFSAITSIQLK